MKVTMYMDVPAYYAPGLPLFATVNPTAGAVSPGWRRVAFQVEIPSKPYDELLPPAQSFDVPLDGPE